MDDDKYSEYLLLLSKPKKNRTYYLHEWVPKFEKDPYFDKELLPVLTAKEYDKHYKSAELVKIYKSLKYHYQVGLEQNLMLTKYQSNKYCQKDRIQMQILLYRKLKKLVLLKIMVWRKLSSLASLKFGNERDRNTWRR